SATWTSGEPVSPSAVPYSAMIFFLAAASIDTALLLHDSVRRKKPGHEGMGSDTVTARTNSHRRVCGHPPQRRARAVLAPSGADARARHTWTSQAYRNTGSGLPDGKVPPLTPGTEAQDRKSTRLNSSHVSNSYAVFCLKKQKAC